MLIFNPHQITSLKLSWATLIVSPRKSMQAVSWVCASIVLGLMLKVLVESLQKDLWEDPGPWTHIKFHSGYKTHVWLTIIIFLFIFHFH